MFLIIFWFTFTCRSMFTSTSTIFCPLIILSFLQFVPVPVPVHDIDVWLQEMKTVSLPDKKNEWNQKSLLNSDTAYSKIKPNTRSAALF